MRDIEGIFAGMEFKYISAMTKCIFMGASRDRII
jgi:hypothetical protein